jgi:hypothetical protein
MPTIVKPVACTFLFVVFVFYACKNQGCDNSASVNNDSLSAKQIIPAKNRDSTKLKKIDFHKLYGNWIQYDTEYAGKFTEIKTLLKDTTRLINKIEWYRNHGGCDGGCIFASRFTKDGILQKRMDDAGEVYSFKIDSVKNDIVVLTHMFKGKKSPADTMWNIQITYLDDNFLLEYYPGEKGKTGRTEMFKRTNWNFQ